MTELVLLVEAEHVGVVETIVLELNSLKVVPGLRCLDLWPAEEPLDRERRMSALDRIDSSRVEVERVERLGGREGQRDDTERLAGGERPVA